MEKKYFDFDNIRDREDFYIALVVLAFFGWLLWQFGFDHGVDNVKNTVTQVVAPKIEETKIVEPRIEDSDNDGIANSEDACPLKYGYAIYSGCPDRETVGKGGAAVAAASTAVVAKAKDSDNDGVMDRADHCPNIVGVASNNGCPPDTDRDGVYDRVDKCPTERGVAANQGCPPDADKDGVADAIDKCPNQRGTQQYNGCPPPADQDRDGVPDAQDKCPRLAGIPANNGCPADSDKDGVYDKSDRCPNEAGPQSNNGCPEVKLNAADQKLLQDVSKNVEFKSASAELKASSVKIMRDLAGLMKKYPNSKLTIGGHTDNVGVAANNLKLSESRAIACMEFLKKQGIVANRMSARGFGDTQPKATNDTPAGRKQNRRVEFTLK